MSVLALTSTRGKRSAADADALVLDDGTRITLRRSSVGRVTDLDALFTGMSPASRWYRFLTGTSRLPAQALAHLADVDQRDHVAWLGYDGEECVAEARYVRLRSAPACAEVALAITDRLQGRGLGRALVRLLAEEAVADGITRFCCTVDGENVRALRLLQSLGMSGRRASGLVEGELVLEAA